MKEELQVNTVKKKALIGGVFGLLLFSAVLLFILPYAWREVDRAYPFLSSDISVYGQLNQPILSDDWHYLQPFLLETLLTSEDSMLLDLLYHSSGSKKGFFYQGQNLFIFTEGEFFLEEPAKYPLFQSSIDKFGQEYRILGFSKYRQDKRWSFSALKAKQELLTLKGNQVIQLAIRGGLDYSFGFIDIGSDKVQIDIGQKESLKSSRISRDTPDISFYSSNSVLISPENLLMVHKTGAILTNFILFGDFYYDGATPIESDTDLFSSQSWSFRGNVEEERAKELLLDIVDYLAEEFPQAISRELPDHSQVFELQRNTDRFLPEEGLLLDSGIITYTHGQIRYTYDGGVLSVEQGELDTSKVVENNCLFEGSLLYGRELYTEPGGGLWKNVSFALSSQRILICADLRSQVIPNQE